MKALQNLIALFALAFLGLALAPQTVAEEQVSVRATLILGSNAGTGVDRSLAKYERNLTRVLRFDSFKQVGSGSARIAAPGSATIGLSNGHTVQVNLKDAGEGKLRISQKWSKSGRILVNTTTLTARNRPLVQVGPAEGDGKLILLLVAN